MRVFKPTFARQPQTYEVDAQYRFDWIAISYRPDPISEEPREVIIGRGFSTRADTINIQLDALPIEFR